jgi:hypothetical protein
METIAPAELAPNTLQTITANFAGQAVVSFSRDVDAVPSHHFGRSARESSCSSKAQAQRK